MNRILSKNRHLFIAAAAILIAIAPVSAKADTYPIVCGASADTCERWAATELSAFLQEIYAEDTFPIIETAPDKGDYIWLGTPKHLGNLKLFIKSNDTDEAGEFVVKHATKGTRQIGIICGNNPYAVLDGVYALLEQQLGYGFYLYRNASENKVKGPFDFQKWDLSATPLIKERVCFNWYNFISGVTAWNLSDYKHWIRQATRMRHTEVMLHTYGWGPFTQFTHNGITKSVGYLQNTAYGSHWGVKHTPDIRKLIGGEHLADEGPIFGADVSKIGYGGVTEENRAARAKAMLREAIDYAANTVGMEFNWSFDIDTTFANPQDIIKTLPETDRFKVGEYWLARPDTKNGYLFFKKIIETTMTDYPAISKITVWWRGGTGASFGGLTNTMKPEHVPAEWRAEFDAAPQGVKDAFGPGHLYHAKVARAFRRALDDMGLSHIELCYGSWWKRGNHTNFAAANRFMPREMACYGLDYNMVFGENKKYREQLKKTGVNRPLVVIQWAHHDDGKYLGRPYVPPVDFAEKLKETNASGYGVIHWTTRPLDIFFKSLANQVWSNTADEPIETTCKKMAFDFFDESQGAVMTEYLHTWLTTAPSFGRETGNLLDAPGVGGSVSEHDNRIKGCDNRIAILDQVDIEQLSPRALEAWKFFRGHEEWIKLFHMAHKTRNPDLRKQAILKYAEKASYDGNMTRGEKGILIQHNLKWLKDLAK
jgi:hypothetical protein